MPKPNIIICKTPKNFELSNCLTHSAYAYQSGEFYMDFSKINSVDDIVERLDWMESRGYHLTNDRGWVYRSINLSNVIENLRMDAFKHREVNGILARHLTRSGNLRQRVVELLNKDLNMTTGDDEDE